MKSVFFACLVAAVYAEAAPEADADAWYGNYGYGAGYSYGARPYVNLGYRSYNSVAGYAPYVAASSYGAYPAAYGYGHAIGKRSADAEAAPEADADAWYGNNGYAAAVAAPVSAYRYAAAPVSAYRYAAAPVSAYSYAPYAARSYGYAARSYGLW